MMVAMIREALLMMVIIGVLGLGSVMPRFSWSWFLKDFGLHCLTFTKQLPPTLSNKKVLRESRGKYLCQASEGSRRLPKRMNSRKSSKRPLLREGVTKINSQSFKRCINQVHFEKYTSYLGQKVEVEGSPYSTTVLHQSKKKIEPKLSTLIRQVDQIEDIFLKPSL